jgi:pimeloyl-ACP methyl ester carboxylesterase
MRLFRCLLALALGTAVWALTPPRPGVYNRLMAETQKIPLLVAGEWVETAYSDVGQGDEVVVCVHGLTRNRHDFDFLAERLSPHFRVISIDIAGRGDSGWLLNKLSYAVPTYVGQVLALLGVLGIRQAAWVGTSMGGLIGISLASLPHSPIQRMVINDIGMELPTDALDRIARLIRRTRYSSYAEATRDLKRRYAPFGPLTDAEWDHLIRHSLKQESDGGFRAKYDPDIALGFEAAVSGLPVNLWPLWEPLTQRMLLIRGETSDLLPRDLARDMARRNPRCQWVEIPVCGHAPALMNPEQTELVCQWLQGSKPSPVLNC